MTFFILRTLRRMNCHPKYLPGKYLKDLWNRWHVGPKYGQVPDPPARAQDTAYHPPSAAEGGTEMNTAAQNGIHRDTSIRSVITLPAYSANPKPTEQIIAREGEREGMDVVVEFPETAEEEEARREESMESLYQIRLRRRQEIAEREARRAARREARANGNTERLETLRMESQARRNRSSTNESDSNRSASTLLREHRARSRDGRIARVNYAALGCVRHDGSRVRANSAESDNQPLLEAGNTSSFHSRDDSITSLMSGSTSDADTLHPVHSQAASARQSMAAEEGDVGGLNIPPPDYDHVEWGEAPAYDSPNAETSAEAQQQQQQQHLRLPEVTPLPAIHIDVASPVSDSPSSPNPIHRSSSTSLANSPAALERGVQVQRSSSTSSV